MHLVFFAINLKIFFKEDIEYIIYLILSLNILLIDLKHLFHYVSYNFLISSCSSNSKL